VKNEDLTPFFSGERRPKESEFVFPSRDGEGPRRDVNHQVRRLCEMAGIPKIFRPLHGLRHVYASMLASSGQVDMYTLQRLLTHKSPLMTQRYAHLRDKALRRASKVAEEILQRQEKRLVLRLKEPS
jgi:integrase